MLLLKNALASILRPAEDEMTKFPYRISRYGYKSWQIERQVKIKKGKNKGKVKWEVYRYPGNKLQAVQGLIDLAMPTDESYSLRDFDKLIAAIEKAERVILASFEKTQKEKEQNE